jgi:putative flippase GtrA
MPNALDTTIAWSRSHEGKKMLRYTMASVISTGVSFVSLAIIFGLHWMSQVPATVTANAIATIPSYQLNRKWAWGKGGRSHLTKEILPFWSMACLGIFVSIFGAYFAKHVSVTHHLPHLEQTIVVLAANVLSFAVFWVLKLLLFNRLFHETELEEFDEHLTAEERATSH